MLSVSTVPCGAPVSNSRTSGSRCPTVAQCGAQAGCQPTSSDTASPCKPFNPAVSAAPTVPECRIARPTFAPWLTPARTSSGAGSNQPRTAARTMYAGWASTAYACTPGSPASCRRRPTRRIDEITVEAGAAGSPDRQPQQLGTNGRRGHAGAPGPRSGVDQGSDQAPQQHGIVGVQADVGNAHFHRRVLARQPRV